MHEFHVLVVSDFLHCLPEYTIIHEFEEVLLKLTLCVFSSFGIEIYIRLEPATLGKFDDSMYSSHSNTQFDIQV